MNHEGAMTRAAIETQQVGFDWPDLGSAASAGKFRCAYLMSRVAIEVTSPLVTICNSVHKKAIT